MPREKSVAAGIVSLAVFLLLEAASLLMLTHNGTLQRLAVARIGHGFMAKTWGTTQRISGYFSLARTNDELAQENHSLTERLRALKAVAEVPPYDSLTAVPPDGFKYTPAKIIKSGTNSQHNYILIDKIQFANVRTTPLQRRRGDGRCSIHMLSAAGATMVRSGVFRADVLEKVSAETLARVRDGRYDFRKYQ